LCVLCLNPLPEVTGRLQLGRGEVSEISKRGASRDSQKQDHRWSGDDPSRCYLRGRNLESDRAVVLVGDPDLVVCLRDHRAVSGALGRGVRGGEVRRIPPPRRRLALFLPGLQAVVGRGPVPRHARRERTPFGAPGQVAALMSLRRPGRRAPSGAGGHRSFIYNS